MSLIRGASFQSLIAKTLSDKMIWYTSFCLPPPLQLRLNSGCLLLDRRRTDGLTPVLDEKVLGWATPLSQSPINSLRNGSQATATTGHLIRMEQRDREKQRKRTWSPKPYPVLLSFCSSSSAKHCGRLNDHVSHIINTISSLVCVSSSHQFLLHPFVTLHLPYKCISTVRLRKK